MREEAGPEPVCDGSWSLANKSKTETPNALIIGLAAGSKRDAHAFTFGAIMMHSPQKLLVLAIWRW